MKIRSEVGPFLGAVAAVGGGALVMLFVTGVWSRSSVTGCLIIIGLLSGYFLYFFRDPERHPPRDANALVAGADGVIASVGPVTETAHLNAPCVRISIFLSLLDVHVNRAPMAGQARFLGYFPGRRLFTFQEKSSELNQHNKILIDGLQTRCLICQIVGPVCRRVVYWPAHDRPVPVAMGERIGMMKFGSRLDMYFPFDDIEVTIQSGDRVRAGETVVARLNPRRTAKETATANMKGIA